MEDSVRMEGVEVQEQKRWLGTGDSQGHLQNFEQRRMQLKN